MRAKKNPSNGSAEKTVRAIRRRVARNASMASRSQHGPMPPSRPAQDSANARSVPHPFAAPLTRHAPRVRSDIGPPCLAGRKLWCPTPCAANRSSTLWLARSGRQIHRWRCEIIAKAFEPGPRRARLDSMPSRRAIAVAGRSAVRLRALRGALRVFFKQS